MIEQQTEKARLISKYKEMLKEPIDKRPAGLRGQLAVALGKHKSFISGDDDLGFVNIVTEDGGAPTVLEQKSDRRQYAIDLTDAESGLSVDDIAIPGESSDFAIQLDVNFTDTNSGIIASGASETGEYFTLSYSAGAILFDIGKGSQSTRIVTPTGIVEPGRWIALTGLYEEGVASIVYDDVCVASYPAPAPIGSSPMTLELGMASASKSMQIKALNLWQRALSEDELMVDTAGGEPLDRESLLLKLGPWHHPITARRLPDSGPQQQKGELTGRIERLWTTVDEANRD